MSKKHEVLTILKENRKGGVTVQQAMRALYINDFRKNVSDLRMHHIIEDIWEQNENTGAR